MQEISIEPYITISKNTDTYFQEEHSFLQYIGSKRKLIKNIVKNFKGNLIVDLMAGTHSLGFFLKDKVRVLANDVMKYSYIIGKAIIESSISDLPLIDIEFSNNYNFFERNYAGTYFTLEQCKDLDGIKYSIEKINDFNLKACYYSSLFNILDRIGTTAGHFDGFLNSNTKKAIKRKDKDVKEYFNREVLNFSNKPNKYGSKVFNMESIDFLNQLTKADTIYIDPPYNHRQYSTLYHIPEMFIRYSGEIKKCKYKYPKDRYFSPYCYRSKALDAFRRLIMICSNKCDNVVFSYSNKGILSIENLKNLFSDYFSKIRVEQIDYYHRKQKTSKGYGFVKEYIFTLRKYN